MMTKKGEKGKCLECPKLYMDDVEVVAWCVYKNMRCLIDLKFEVDGEPKTRRELKSQLREKYKGQLRKKLGERVNPSWCPLRQEGGCYR